MVLFFFCHESLQMLPLILHKFFDISLSQNFTFSNFCLVLQIFNLPCVFSQIRRILLALHVLLDNTAAIPTPRKGIENCEGKAISNARVFQGSF